MNGIRFFIGMIFVSGIVIAMEQTQSEQTFGCPDTHSKFGSPISVQSQKDLELGNYQESDVLLSERTAANKQLVKNIRESLKIECSDDYLEAQVAQLKLMNDKEYAELVGYFDPFRQASINATSRHNDPAEKSPLAKMYELVARAALVEKDAEKQRAIEHAKRANRNQWLALLGAAVASTLGYYVNQVCTN